MLDLVALAAVAGGVAAANVWWRHQPRGRVEAALSAAGITAEVESAELSPAAAEVVLDTNLTRVQAAELAKVLGFTEAPIIDGRRIFLTRATELAAWETRWPDGPPDPRNLPVARDATGRHWRMPILGAHWLIVGATGSGKGSVIWSLVNELAPLVADGKCHLWGIDPKGGVELAFGAPLFERVAFYDADAEAWEMQLGDLLADARALMDARLARMQGITRLHKPSRREPMVVLIVDEFLTLTLGVTDTARKKQIQRDLVMLLSKGRAAGVSVLACTQVAQKATLEQMRDLFPYRVALRTTDVEQSRMALGNNAVALGGEAHHISPKTPGVAYVLGEAGAPRLVRFPFTSDSGVRAIARHFAPPRRPAPVELPAAPEPEPEPPAAARAETKTEIVQRLLGEEPDADDAWLAESAGCTVRHVRRVRAASQPS